MRVRNVFTGCGGGEQFPSQTIRGLARRGQRPAHQCTNLKYEAAHAVLENSPAIYGWELAESAKSPFRDERIVTNSRGHKRPWGYSMWCQIILDGLSGAFGQTSRCAAKPLPPSRR